MRPTILAGLTTTPTEPTAQVVVPEPLTPSFGADGVLDIAKREDDHEPDPKTERQTLALVMPNGREIGIVLVNDTFHANYNAVTFARTSRTITAQEWTLILVEGTKQSDNMNKALGWAINEALRRFGGKLLKKQKYMVLDHGHNMAKPEA